MSTSQPQPTSTANPPARQKQPPAPSSPVMEKILARQEQLWRMMSQILAHLEPQVGESGSAGSPDGLVPPDPMKALLQAIEDLAKGSLENRALLEGVIAWQIDPRAIKKLEALLANSRSGT